RLRGQGGHRPRYQDAPGAARAPRRPGDRGASVHPRLGAAPRGRALGPPGGGREGRLHRVDGARKAPPSAPARDRRRRARGERVITHAEKVLFPEDGITKGELAAYYEAIAPVMLPHIRGRPVMLERYPSGIGAKGFWQKDVIRGFPDWLERVEVPKKGG